ncbi:conjugal transfer protein TraG N-terminal domain-containing protein [Burkholderia glumae]|uniref:conjugal transfer protein TraG N-terminal domain-containing protein n=1 Tax=Burkholderia glumae TaxID=337 RepID=UPI0021507E20|nr:conjugal transfer protein TraG N-terminal domain-containing protein [Burkholderia glumae]
MEIDTYGNVDTLYYVFNGIASFMGSGSFSGFMRFTLLSGLLIAMVAAIGRKSTDIVKWFASAMFITQLLVAPVENVFITDVTGVQPTREVDHVPAYLSAIAQASTTVSTAVTQAYETVFSVPDSLQLQKGDLGFGISVLQKVNQAQIVDPGLEADLMQFFKECTVYDIQDGAINPQTIMSGTDPFNTVFTQTSPARYVTTNTLTANPTTDTCLATGTLLLIRVTDAEQKAEQMYGKEMYPQVTDASAAKAAFVNAIGDSYGFILQSSQNASSALRQAMFNNVWRQAGADLPAMLNDPARVAEVNALMSSAQAAVAANGSMASVAILAKETLPTVRNYAEAIIYTIFPIVIVLCLVGGGEAAKRILGGYAKTIAWIGLWPVIFAVLNGLSLMHLSSKMQAMSLQAGVPFGMAAKFGSTLIDEQVLLGYMVILTPALAWGLLNMATTSVVGAFQGVMEASKASLSRSVVSKHRVTKTSAMSTWIRRRSVTRRAMSRRRTNTTPRACSERGQRPSSRARAHRSRTSTTGSSRAPTRRAAWDLRCLRRAPLRSPSAPIRRQACPRAKRVRRFPDARSWHRARPPSRMARTAALRSARAMRRPPECVDRRRKPWTANAMSVRIMGLTNPMP